MTSCDADSITLEGDSMSATGCIGLGKLIPSNSTNGPALYPIGGMPCGWAIAVGTDIWMYLLCDSVGSAGIAG